MDLLNDRVIFEYFMRSISLIYMCFFLVWFYWPNYFTSSGKYFYSLLSSENCHLQYLNLVLLIYNFRTFHVV